MLRLDLSRKNLAKALGSYHVERGVEQFTQLGGPQHLPWASIPNKTSLCQKPVSYTHLTLPTIYSV